jgi:hypothetical protein
MSRPYIVPHKPKTIPNLNGVDPRCRYSAENELVRLLLIKPSAQPSLNRHLPHLSLIKPSTSQLPPQGTLPHTSENRQSPRSPKAKSRTLSGPAALAVRIEPRSYRQSHSED